MSKSAARPAAASVALPVAADSVPAARLWVLWCALPLALGWSYWPTLLDLLSFWMRNEDYSVGALVLPVALLLAVLERDQLRALPRRFSGWGVPLIAFAEFTRAVGQYYGIVSLERYALLLCIAGVLLLSCGVAWFRRLSWKLLFLLLMIPPPARLHEAIALPLQDLATGLAVFMLELLGFLITREGHVLRLENGAVLAVQEACSGLRMLTAFVFVSAVLAFWVDRAFWQRALLLASSVPIAILANALRILATALLARSVGSGQVLDTFHDVAGFAMMPLAMLAGLGLLRLLDVLGFERRSVRSPRLAGS